MLLYPMNRQPSIANRQSIHRSLREYARGIAGGLIFSMPLLYTMEVWWVGLSADPLRLAVSVVVTFLLLLGYNRFVGLRSDADWREVMIDSVEEMGIGIVTAAGVLLLLGRIGSAMPMEEVVGKVIVEAMTIAIGVSVGTAQLGSNEGEDGEDTGMSSDQHHRLTFGAQVTIAFCGAMLFAMNIAPTEEVLVIAAEISPWETLLVAVVSIAIGIGILYYIDFTGSRRFVDDGGTWNVPMGGIVMYAIALAASALTLWFFGRLDDQGNDIRIAEIVVLGLVATLGSSAGRLLLQMQ